MKRVLFVVAVVVLLAWLSWLVLDTEDQAPAAPTPGVVEPDASAPATVPSAPAAADTPAHPLAPPEGGAPRAALPDDDFDFEGPILAQGQVVSDLVLAFDDLEVTVYDAEGDDLTWETLAPDGTFAVRWDGALRAGWGVSCSASELELDGGGTMPLLPDWCGPYGDHAPGDPPVECVLRVRAAPVIVGTVLDVLTGAPIEGAEITVGSTLAAFALDESWAETDDLGRYRLQTEILPPRGTIVWCREWEHQAVMSGPFDLSDHDVLQVDFRMSASRSLEGVVVDASTGRPVSGAPVTLGSPWPGFENDEDWDFTDEEGRFALEASDMPLEGAWVHVEGVDGYGAASLPVPPGETGELRVALGPLQHLRGLVVDTHDVPVAGADVHVVFHEGFLGIDAGLANGESTEADGTFAMELDAAPPESSRLLVTSDDHRPYTVALVDVAERAALENVWYVKVVLERVADE